MKILAIDTSCDETAAGVTEGVKIKSNIIWSQALDHAKFGGVMPSLAQRMHEERIDWVIYKALTSAKTRIEDVDAIAVTNGPGLSIALGVGINKARELSNKYKKRLISVNHIEAHLLSPFAKSGQKDFKLPALGLVISGGNTLLIEIIKIGSYKILAETTDDALGEALDKAARMLGLGYPGGAVLEIFARKGNLKKYSLPIPIIGQEKRQIFTYSGLKTAFSRLVETEKPLTKNKIYDLAATFQNTAFTHITRIISYIITNSNIRYNNLLIGGGVSANIELRKRLRLLCKNQKISIHFPYSKKLTGDNAGMIGVAAYLHPIYTSSRNIDRFPNLKLA